MPKDTEEINIELPSEINYTCDIYNVTDSLKWYLGEINRCLYRIFKKNKIIHLEVSFFSNFNYINLKFYRIIKFLLWYFNSLFKNVLF